MTSTGVNYTKDTKDDYGTTSVPTPVLKRSDALYGITSIPIPVLKRSKALCGCGHDCNNILEHFPGQKCPCELIQGGCDFSKDGCNCGCGK